MVRHRPAIAAAGLLVAVVVACSPANTSPAQSATAGPTAPSVRTCGVWTGPRRVTGASRVVAQSDEELDRPSAARPQLAALAAGLLAPESWLPVTAWSVATSRPYVPDGFRVVVSTEQVGGSQPDVSAVDWPFTIPIADLGEPISASSQIFTPVGPGTKPLRCAALDASDAKAARDAIQRAGAGVADFPDGAFSTGLMWKAGGSGIVLFFQAVLPDQSSCADPY